MADLNKRPWCGCCTNDQIFEAAETVIDTLIQQRYKKPMCIGSIYHVLVTAEFLMGGTVAETVMHQRGLNLLGPFGQMMADDMLSDENANNLNDLAKWLDSQPNDWKEKLHNKIDALEEIRKADEEYETKKGD